MRPRLMNCCLRAVYLSINELITVAEAISTAIAVNCFLLRDWGGARPGLRLWTILIIRAPSIWINPIARCWWGRMAAAQSIPNLLVEICVRRLSRSRQPPLMWPTWCDGPIQIQWSFRSSFFQCLFRSPTTVVCWHHQGVMRSPLELST